MLRIFLNSKSKITHKNCTHAAMDYLCLCLSVCRLSLFWRRRIHRTGCLPTTISQFMHVGYFSHNFHLIISFIPFGYSWFYVIFCRFRTHFILICFPRRLFSWTEFCAWLANVAPTEMPFRQLFLFLKFHFFPVLTKSCDRAAQLKGCV